LPLLIADFEGPPMKSRLPLIVTILFSIVGVVGDYLLKLASDQKNPLKAGSNYLGFVYASTAFGWVYVMRHLKLAKIGAVYSVSMILLLTGVGAVVFRQPLSPPVKTRTGTEIRTITTLRSAELRTTLHRLRVGES
jgi:hypothetical protein